MASSVIPTRSLHLRRCAPSAAVGRKDEQRISWWSPIFGWSSEPDYIDSGNVPSEDSAAAPNERSEADLARRSVRSRTPACCFTEEKARRLRMMTTGTNTFHDAMYHSAIASRLASDFSERFDT